MISETDLLSRFQSVKRNRADDWHVACPAYADDGPSLHVTRLDGRWLLHCMAGCVIGDVLDAARLDWADLYDGPSKPWTPDGLRRLGVTQSPDGRVRLGGVSYLPNAHKGERKTKAPAGSTRDLWPAPETIEGPVLYVVEGEPDAITAASLGLPAVAIPGAAKWRDEWAARLAGGRETVVVIADCDGPGRQIAGKAAAAIAAQGPSVRVVGQDPSLDIGYDLSDFHNIVQPLRGAPSRPRRAPEPPGAAHPVEGRERGR